MLDKRHRVQRESVTGLEPSSISTKSFTNDMLKVGYDSLSHLSQQNKTSGRNDEKMVARQTLLMVGWTSSSASIEPYSPCKGPISSS